MKHTYTLIFVFIFLFTTISYAQTPVSKDTITKVQDFFEWTFNERFTADERETFAQQIIESYRTGDIKTIDSVNSILKIREQTLSLSAEKRDEFRQKVQPMLVEEFSKTPNDPTSGLLLGVYRRSQNNILNQTSSNAIPQNVSSNGQSGASLIGEWSQSDMRTVGFTNSSGGYAAPSGEKVGMRFFADGTYKSAYFNQSSMYSCTITIFAYKTGVYRIVGSTVYLDEKTYTLSQKDSCNSSRNSETHPALSHIKYDFRIGSDKDGPQLILKTKSGEDVFYKEQGKGLLGDN